MVGAVCKGFDGEGKFVKGIVKEARDSHPEPDPHTEITSPVDHSKYPSPA